MIIRWMTVLGIVGFVCGFLGPMVLAPDANQGPMLGIFITGPGGAVLGVILGLIVRTLGWSSRRNSRMLAYCSAVLAAVTLYFCIPSARHRTDIVEGTISACTPADSLKEKTVDALNTITAQHRNAKPIQWNEKFDQATRERPGVVIAMHITRYIRVSEKQASWNRGELVAGSWIASGKDARYFADYAGNDCTQYPTAERMLLATAGHVGIWPASGIAEMLNMQTARPLAPEYTKLMEQQRSR